MHKTKRTETWSVGVGQSEYEDGRHAPDFGCGHKHKKVATAEECEGKLKRFRCDNCGRPWGNCRGTSFACRSPKMVCSARWYNSYIFKEIDGKIVQGQ